MATLSASEIQFLVKQRKILSVLLVINALLGIIMTFWAITLKVKLEKEKAFVQQYKTLYEDLLKKK